MGSQPSDLKARKAIFWPALVNRFSTKTHSAACSNPTFYITFTSITLKNWSSVVNIFLPSSNVKS